MDMEKEQNKSNIMTHTDHYQLCSIVREPRWIRRPASVVSCVSFVNSVDGKGPSTFVERGNA